MTFWRPAARSWSGGAMLLRLTRWLPVSPHSIFRIITRIEPLLLVALTPFFWFPRAGSGFLLLVIPLLWIARRTAHGRFSVRTPYDAATACLLLCLPLALWPVVDWSLATWKLYGLLLGAALMYALANALCTPGLVRAGLWIVALVFGGGIGVLGLLGVQWPAQKLLPLESAYQWLQPLSHSFRRMLPVESVHRNEIAGALVLLLPLTVTLAVTPAASLVRQAWIGRLVFGGLTLLMLAALLLTQSRSGFAGALAALLLLGYQWLVKERSLGGGRLIGSGGLALLVATAGWLGWLMVQSWQSVPGQSLDTLPGRLEIWNRSISMLQDFPFTGVGIGQFSAVLHSLYAPLLISPDVYVPHAHNFFLQLGLDLGIPGAVAVIFLLGSFLREMWRVFWRAEDEQFRRLALALGAGLVAYLVFGLVDAIAIGARGGICLWVVLGLGAALVQVALPWRQHLGRASVLR